MEKKLPGNAIERIDAAIEHICAQAQAFTIERIPTSAETLAPLLSSVPHEQ
jgi:hypothetical protein